MSISVLALIGIGFTVFLGYHLKMYHNNVEMMLRIADNKVKRRDAVIARQCESFDELEKYSLQLLEDIKAISGE